SMTVALWAACITLAAALPRAAAAAPQGSGNGQGEVGSLEDYLASGRDSLPAYNVPELGIEVTEGVARLQTGERLRGVDVLQLTNDGKAARAGLRGRRIVAKQLVTGVLAIGGLFFPPVLFAAIAVGHSNFGESRDTIVAVDSERTRDGQEFSSAL